MITEPPPPSGIYGGVTEDVLKDLQGEKLPTLTTPPTILTPSTRYDRWAGEGGLG